MIFRLYAYTRFQKIIASLGKNLAIDAMMRLKNLKFGISRIMYIYITPFSMFLLSLVHVRQEMLIVFLLL